MSTEWILQELYALWDKLKILFERFLDAPAIIRAWSEGRASTGDRAALVVSVVLIVAVVAWVVNFFKAGFWKKLGMLLSAALLILAAAIVLSFFSKAEESPQPELPGVSDTPWSAAPWSAEESAAPEQTLSPDAPTPSPAPPLRSDGRYSLARGEADPVYPRTAAMWRLCDDTVSWQLGDGLLLQLSGLHTLPGTGRFGVEELAQYSDTAYICLRRTEGSGDAHANRRSECVLEIFIRPGAKLERQPWYAEAPSYISTGEGEGYSVFQNSGGEVLFLEKDAKIVNKNGDAVLALCMGRQLDGDVVLVKARAFTAETDEDHTEYTELNPGTDDELKRRLLELERAVFDGRIRLLRGMTEQGLAAILPGSLVDQSVGTPSGRGGFSIPCTRLLEMRRSEGLGAVIRLIGPGPKGEELLYSLVDGAMLYENVRSDRYFTWREAYEKGWLDPDAEMTAFLGCPAVRADGGWILDPGDFYSSTAGGVMENYYFLSTEVLTPAPTPEPTPEPTPDATAMPEGAQENG